MPIDILLVEKDPLIRDHVKVGLQQFADFHVTLGAGYRGINELRSQPFDCVFLGIDPRDKESNGLLQHLRSFDKTTEVVVMTASRNMKDMAGDKARYDIHSFLETPIDPRELFSFVGRFLERTHGRAAPRKAGKQGRPAPMPIQ